MNCFSSNKVAVVLVWFVGATMVPGVPTRTETPTSAPNAQPASPDPRTAADMHPGVPMTWDEKELTALEVPLAQPRFSATHISASYYYKIAVRDIYQSYPIYYPGRAPRSDYVESLRRQEPKVVWGRDPTTGKYVSPNLNTEEDWIEAGRLVFEAPIGTDTESFGNFITPAYVQAPEWYRQTRVRVTKDQVMPFAVYVVRKKGLVEVGNLSCASCHTRVMDASIIKGAQGNLPFDAVVAYDLRIRAAKATDQKKFHEEKLGLMSLLFGAPWLTADNPSARYRKLSLDDLIAAHEVVPPGVLARHGTGHFSPVQVPDLIGLKDRKYLDRTGLVQHRNIGDLMRYGALNQGADFLNRYGDFIPGGNNFRTLPGPNDPKAGSRYSDVQLYALAKYVYSLQPPPNPNLPNTKEENEQVTRGRTIFGRLNCVRCHESPFFTSNRLTPARGFTVPDAHMKSYAILNEVVGIDSTLTLQTRRGTGYYKVPSLKGVWYRGPFEHNGSVLTLEDWFDAKRTGENYVPTGWKGPPGTERRAVTGHRFGLDLSEEDRRALIAFLKTL